jgi:hypothetical protein
MAEQVVLDAPDHVDDDRLNEWLAFTVAPIAAASPTPTVVNLRSGRDYVFPYGLALGSRRASRLHPNLPLFSLNSVVLDGQGATVHIPPWDDDDPRTRYGVPAVHALWANDLTVRNLSVDGGRFGLIAQGTHALTLTGCTFTRPRLDFVYLQSGLMDAETGDRDLNTDVTVASCEFQGAGRQGFVLNGVDGYTQYGCTVRGVDDFVFDVEPNRAGQATGLWIHDNQFPQGGQGFLNYTGKPASAPLGDWRFVNNQITGHLRVRVEPTTDDLGTRYRHSGFVFCDNRNTHPLADQRPYTNRQKALIRVCGWDGVTVTGNQDTVSPLALVLGLNDCTNVVSDPNTWRTAAAA